MFPGLRANVEATMPNGADRNWVRLKHSLEGFFATYGYWPSRVRLPLLCLENLRIVLFTPASWERLIEQIEFIPDESAGMISEEDAGNCVQHGKQGAPQSRPSVRAETWLGVRLETPHADDPR
jgi:hypothetical protein